MGVRRWLQNLVTRSKAFDHASQQFLSVDRSSIEEELDLKGRAEREGRINIPKPDATAKDAMATDIDYHLERILRLGRDEFQDHLRAIDVLDSAQSIDTQLTKLKTSTLKALTKFYTTCKNGINDLYSTKQAVVDGELDYRRFRSENNLCRPVDYPKNRLRGLWWIILILVGEALFNSWALGRVHPDGPLGVFSETVLIAVTNVLIGGAVGGYFWRQLYHVNKVRGFFGYTAIIILTILVLIFNFVVGHYRDSLMRFQMGVAEADVAIFYAGYENLFRSTIANAFSDNFWAFGSFMSFLLIIVGIAMFVLAAIKAFALDDPYPGYGNICRNRDKRNAGYATLFSELQEEVEEIGDDVNVSITGAFEVWHGSQNVRKDHEETLNDLTSKYRSWVSELKSAGTALYTAYRQINEQYRTEAAPPAFKIDFSLSDVMATPPVQLKLAEEQGIEYLRKLRGACLTVVQEASTKYLDIYQTIDRLAPENMKAEHAGTYDIEAEKINAELQRLAQTKGIVDGRE